MYTQWLYFPTEQAANDYNDSCTAFFNGNLQAQTWTGGWDENSRWGNVYQTTDDPLYWVKGSNAGVLGYWGVPFMGLPLWGHETDYRVGAAEFPLNDGGSPPVIWDRAYWLSTIPEDAVFVEDMLPIWPREEDE